LSTSEQDRLLAHLRDWCRQGHGRQSLLASKLNVSKQLVSAWLNGARSMSLDEWLQIKSIIQSTTDAQFPKEPMSTSVSTGRARQTCTDDDEVDYMSTEHASWGQTKEALSAAQEEIIRLRAQLKTQPPSSRGIVIPPADAPLTSIGDPGASASRNTKPVPRTIAPATAADAERAKTTLANASTPDLLNALKLARSEGNAKAVDLIQAEVRARTVTSDSSNQPPAKSLRTLPIEADTPSAIRQIFDRTSMSDLREMLTSERDPVRRQVIFKEISRRKQS
jgi:hypothetical protein